MYPERAAAMRWYGHVLRREESNILKEALNIELEEKKGKTKGYLKKEQIGQALIKNIGLRKEDAPNRKNGD